MICSVFCLFIFCDFDLFGAFVVAAAAVTVVVWSGFVLRLFILYFTAFWGGKRVKIFNQTFVHVFVSLFRRSLLLAYLRVLVSLLRVLVICSSQNQRFVQGHHHKRRRRVKRRTPSTTISNSNNCQYLFILLHCSD